MDKILELVPAKYKALALFTLAVSPYISRAIHALMTGGGIRGVMKAIWLGTNTDKKAVAELIQSNNISMVGAVNPSLPVSQKNTDQIVKQAAGESLPPVDKPVV